MLNREATIEHITSWLRNYCTANHQQGFVVGISGGIDSAVTSTLCARTGLPVLCVEMPIHQAPAQVDRAQEHITWLRWSHANVEESRVDLTPVFDAMVKALPEQEGNAAWHLALANSRARLRMTTLYYFAGIRRALVAGTGNKVEDFGVGFYTKYGDGGVDLSPIADLTKTEVYALAGALGVVKSIQSAKPTDGLFGDDRSDEDQLGASYPELEWAMALREAGQAVEKDELSARQREVLAIYDRLHTANAHKWKAIPVCLVPKDLPR
ncbi:MAG: NAD(+) synthase [Bacteroidetes bacterium]|nr:NAD(+) synthase [Bacteroidota bacterium]MBS1941907.1 NAD(+) synthase [Bacteroidota bacterium]